MQDTRERPVPVLTVMPGHELPPERAAPVPAALWRELSTWAREPARIRFGSRADDERHWDWIAYHARGLALAAQLKAAVGETFRVVYEKPVSDPNHALEHRTELLGGGAQLSLPPAPGAASDRPRFCRRIVSGGQTGADRAALDFAIAHGYPHGGWAPAGRLAEDGRIPMCYQLTELSDGGYRRRTRLNVEGSDGTLLVNLGELEGGSLATLDIAQRLGKPCLVIQADGGVDAGSAREVLGWLRASAIQTLNVAGPREGRRPGIGASVGMLLEAVDGLQ